MPAPRRALERDALDHHGKREHRQGFAERPLRKARDRGSACILHCANDRLMAVPAAASGRDQASEPPSLRLAWTMSGSATRLPRVRAVHTHDIGGRELPIGASLSTVAAAKRQKQQRRRRRSHPRGRRRRRRRSHPRADGDAALRLPRQTLGRLSLRTQGRLASLAAAPAAGGRKRPSRPPPGSPPRPRSSPRRRDTNLARRTGGERLASPAGDRQGDCFAARFARPFRARLDGAVRLR